MHGAVMKTKFPFFQANMAAPRPVTTNAANVAFQAITQSDTDSDDHEGEMIPTRARGSPSITAGLNQIPNPTGKFSWLLVM